MSKRFTDTEKWRDPWFCGLSVCEKMFWIFLLDTCTMSGIWQANWPLVKFYIPDFVYREEVFKDRIQVIREDKWLIKRFTDFQYGPLQETNRMHNRILFELQKEGVSTPLKHPSQGVKDKDRELDKVSLSLGGPGGFDKFWQAYPKKRSRGDAEKAWRTLKPTTELSGRILAALHRAKTSPDWVKEGGQFIPYPATWLRAQGWDDEMQAGGSDGRGGNSIHDRLLARETGKKDQRAWVEGVPGVSRGVDKPPPMRLPEI